MSGLLLLAIISILAIKNYPPPDYCGTSPAFNRTQDALDNVYLDEQTGVLVTLPANQSNNPPFSSASPFQIDVREGDVFLRSANGSSERLIFSSDTLLSAIPADSYTVIVQEFDEMNEEQQIISLNIETGEVNFEYEYPASVRWQTINGQVSPYLYAQFLINPEDNSQGLMFMDTVTGEITRFTDLTAGVYLPSESGRWLASFNSGAISIIYPATGDYHAHLSEPVAGGNFRWQGDDILWFTRRNPQSGATFTTLWRAISGRW